MLRDQQAAARVDVKRARVDGARFDVLNECRLAAGLVDRVHDDAVFATLENLLAADVDDATNKFVYAPTLGTDQMFQFTFDAKSGHLTANTPATFQMKVMTGPRHFITSRDNKFVYVLSELLATVTTLSLDGKTGLLAELGSATGLPADSKLGPGAPRGAVGGPNAPPRNTDNDIWAADIHMTPNEKFLYISERTSSTLAAFSVDAGTGKLAYLGSTPTEKQPRGFAIDPKGRFLVAAGEKSPTISVYAIDQASGALQLLQKYPAGKGANWVEIVGFD